MQQATGISYTRMQYTTQFYRAGKPAGIEDHFGSLADVKYFHSDGNGRVSPMIMVSWNEKPLRDAEGLVCRELKYRFSAKRSAARDAGHCVTSSRRGNVLPPVVVRSKCAANLQRASDGRRGGLVDAAPPLVPAALLPAVVLSGTHRGTITRCAAGS